MPVTEALRAYAEEKIGNSMKVMDNVSWAFHCAHTTAQTYGFLDHSTAVFYFYRTGCTGLLADSTANTADFTLFFCLCPFTLI